MVQDDIACETALWANSHPMFHLSRNVISEQAMNRGSHEMIQERLSNNEAKKTLYLKIKYKRLFFREAANESERSFVVGMAKCGFGTEASAEEGKSRNVQGEKQSTRMLTFWDGFQICMGHSS